jgi:hypothetical protein
MNSRIPSFFRGFLLSLLSLLFPWVLQADPAQMEILQKDYTHSALPLLKQSCFACHGPNPQYPDSFANPDRYKNTLKVISDAQRDFPMSDSFPFPASLNLKADIKELSNSVQKNWMPPQTQKEFNLGRPLTSQDKKNLLKWADRTRRALEQMK